MSRREINAPENIWNHPQGVCILNAAGRRFFLTLALLDPDL